MKFIASAFVFAITLGVSLAATAEEAALLKTGHTLVNSTTKAIEEYHKQGKEHLLLAVEWQLNSVETFIGMIENNRHGFDEPILPAQLVIIDAGLKYTENRLSEELAILKEYIAHPKHEAGNVKELIAHAKELVVKSGAAVRNDQTSMEHSYVNNDISYEIRSIQHVIAQLEHKPAGSDMRKEIEALERNEISLNALLKRIGANHAFY